MIHRERSGQLLHARSKQRVAGKIQLRQRRVGAKAVGQGCHAATRQPQLSCEKRSVGNPAEPRQPIPQPEEWTDPECSQQRSASYIATSCAAATGNALQYTGRRHQHGRQLRSQLERALRFHCLSTYIQQCHYRPASTRPSSNTPSHARMHARTHASRNRSKCASQYSLQVRDRSPVVQVPRPPSATTVHSERNP